jgi:hypothetical protein
LGLAAALSPPSRMLSYRETSVIEGGVALVVQVVEVAAFGVAVDAVAELFEEDVVVDFLGGVAGVVGDVGAVAVAAVGSVVAVVVDEAAVDDSGIGAGAAQDALGGVMDDHVDQAGAIAVEVDACSAARRLVPAGIRPAGGVGVEDFEAPVPGIGAVDVEGVEVAVVVAVEGGPLTGVLAHDDRVGRGAVEVAGVRPDVGAAAQPDRVAGVNRRGMVQSRLKLPGIANAPRPAPTRVRGDVKLRGPRRRGPDEQTENEQR